MPIPYRIGISLAWQNGLTGEDAAMLPLRHWTVLLLLLLSGLAHGQTKPESFRFKVRTVSKEFERPVGMDIAPDGRVFVIELSGRIWLIDPKTGGRKEVARLEVFDQQENGLIGIVLDPNFATNRWIYLHYSPRDYVGIHLSRFTFTKDEKIDLKSEKLLLKWATQRRECCHHAGMMLFGPDGNLYASTGDNTHPSGDSRGYAPIDRRKDRDPWNAEKSSANPNDLRGGILRIRPKDDGTYEIPEGNLFPPGTPGTRPEIYVMGCRNPWKISIDPKTGYLYWGEVGPDAGGDSERGPRGYDEINQARKAGFFGWPYFIADNQAYAKVDMATGKVGPKFDPAKPINDSPLNTGRKELPPAQPAFLYWPYGKSNKWPELGNGGRTACAGPVFHHEAAFTKSDGLPAFYDNCLLFWDWHRPFIKWARLDKDSNFVRFENFELAGTTLKRPTNAEFASDGSLYVLDYGSSWGTNKDSKLVQFSYLSGNLPPLAQIKSSAKHGALPLKVELDASPSSDPEGKPLKYAWSVSPETPLKTNGAKLALKLEKAGDYDVTLKVTDEAGVSSEATTRVVAGNTPPQIAFQSPQDGSFYEPGETLKFALRIQDAEDGDSAKNATPFGGTVVTLAPRRREQPGLAAMRASDCFNCHHVTQKLVGPAFTEIAKRYHGKKDAFDQSVQRIIKGSAKVWGEVPMLPHSQLEPDEVRAMVRWIYALAEDTGAAPQVARGAVGSIALPKQPESLELSANYTDAPKGSSSSHSAGTSIRIHARQVEAEMYDEKHGLEVFPFNEDGKTSQHLGGINNGHWVDYRRFRLAGSKSVTFRVASAGAGATITLQHGETTLATAEAKPTGNWLTWKEVTVPLKNVPEGVVDFRITFHNKEKPHGLMNLDWFRFNKE